MNNEEWSFETLDIVQVAMNNYEGAMNKNNNQFRKMITNSANKGK